MTFSHRRLAARTHSRRRLVAGTLSHQCEILFCSMIDGQSSDDGQLNDDGRPRTTMDDLATRNGQSATSEMDDGATRNGRWSDERNG